MSYGNPKAACGTATFAHGATVNPATSAEPKTLEQIIQDAVSYVGEIAEVHKQADRIHNRLCGPRPESCGLGETPPTAGQISALDAFHVQAWRELIELRGLLNRIEAALG